MAKSVKKGRSVVKYYVVTDRGREFLKVALENPVFEMFLRMIKPFGLSFARV